MIREMLRPTNEYINIKVPQEYIGQELEVLIFSNSEVKSSKKIIKLKNYFKNLTLIMGK